jgi:hypothetical protein
MTRRHGTSVARAAYSMSTREPLPISNTGLRRTRGGENCAAIPVPPNPSPTASREAQMAGYQARGDALVKQAACYQADADNLNSLIDQLHAINAKR